VERTINTFYYIQVSRSIKNNIHMITSNHRPRTDVIKIYHNYNKVRLVTGILLSTSLYKLKVYPH